MKFIKRKSAPSSTNKFYLKAGSGGYNKAMEIDKKTHSCLPNCAGLVHGRWLECQDKIDYNKFDKLPTGNPENYFLSNKDNYLRGQTPRLGSVVCFEGIGKKTGHVAFVEAIEQNGDIITSNSSYGGRRFFMKTLTRKSNYKYGSDFIFQGFIYNPVDFSEVTPDVKRDKTKNQVKVITTNLRVREDHNTESKIIGFVKYKGIYNFYETYYDKKYTWYRIAYNEWIADNGKWLKVYYE